MQQREPQAAVMCRDFLTFTLGHEEYGIDILKVQEIREIDRVTRVPKVARHVRGVINLRGAVLPIVDLGARLGLGAADPTARHVIIVAQVQNQVVGLLVDAVSDILTVTDDMIQPTPDVASEMVRTFVRGLLAIEGRMVSFISLDRVLPDSELDHAA